MNDLYSLFPHIENPFLLDCIPIGHHYSPVYLFWPATLDLNKEHGSLKLLGSLRRRLYLLSFKTHKIETKLHVSTSLSTVRSFPMSSTVDYHSSCSTLGAPTINLTEDCPLKALEISGPSQTVPFRNGLPTPPHDMTGVTYNAMPPFAYGGQPNVPSHIYGHPRPQFDAISGSMMAAMKPQSHPSMKEAHTEPTAQKKSTGTGGSQLRIPSSINNSKGSLAEFAAQVRSAGFSRSGLELTRFPR